MRTEIDDMIDDLTDVKIYALESLVKIEQSLRTTYDSPNDVLSSTIQDQLLETEERIVRVAFMCFEELSKLRETRKEADDVRAD